MDAAAHRRAFPRFSNLAPGGDKRCRTCPTARAWRRCAPSTRRRSATRSKSSRPDARAYGFNRRPLVAPFPELKPVVGFARTALIRSREPHPRDRDSATKLRLGYYEHIAAEPLPSISVIQDIDAPDTGFGAFWGEVQTHVHAGLGCVGVITDGSVRDLDAMSPGFFVLAGSVMPSHAHVHLVEFGGTVSVAGMVVSANDVIHADRHGAVVIPHEAVEKIPAAVDLLARRERVIIEASKQPGFSIERLRQAFKEQEEIH